MVRFHWQIEGGLSAFVPPGGIQGHRDAVVRHITCEVEVSVQKEMMETLYTLPANYLSGGQVKSIGVMLCHSVNGPEWKGKFMTELAVGLACEGYLVVRYNCKQKETRRARMCERTMDACACSPYARGVDSWVLMGMGNGARVAAVVGGRYREPPSGFIFLSYPVEEMVMPVGKRKAAEQLEGPKSSDAPLLKLRQPILFIKGDQDALCSTASLVNVCRRMRGVDTRLVQIQDADENFKAPGGRGPALPLMREITMDALVFLDALLTNSLDSCRLPSSLDMEVLEAEDAVARSEASDGVERNDDIDLAGIASFPAAAPSFDIARMSFGMPTAFPGMPSEQSSAQHLPVLPFNNLNITAATLSLAPGGQGQAPPSSLGALAFRPAYGQQ